MMNNLQMHVVYIYEGMHMALYMYTCIYIYNVIFIHIYAYKAYLREYRKIV